MREIYLDLSADDNGAQYRFAGFGGEHNATKLTVLLPDRMKKEGAEYRFLFETASGDAVFSAPILLNSEGKLSVMLTKSLMLPPVLTACVGCYVKEGKEVVLAAKSSQILLGVQKSTEDDGVEQNQNGGEIPGLVIDGALSAESKNPVENRAVFAALSEKLDRAAYRVEMDLIPESENPVSSKTLCASVANAAIVRTEGIGVRAENVSPIGHDFKLEAGVEGERIWRYGKNLCPTFSVTTNEHSYGLVFLTNVPWSGTYTLSCDVTRKPKDITFGSRVSIRVMYEDGSMETVSEDSEDGENDGVTRRKSVTVKTDPEKKIKYLYLFTLDCVTFSQRDAVAERIQLEYSPEESHYEAYRQPVFFDLSENETVKTIPSETQNATYFSESGKPLALTYHRDVGKMLERLQKRCQKAEVKGAILYLKEVEGQ